ncbi:hypothetical protein [Nocardia farcinica]|uniref:hypothetical protein n=1 Tax=Nocardia farcinica TaxID=37329 RepID=UPI001895AB59|nr:hypothetical protein [Nocardia farcinica]MBF6315031.1 hypothetical protein [Nocardia farcinica]
MPVPFSTTKVVTNSATPVVLTTWQRTDKPFTVFVHNHSGGGTVYLTNSPTGTVDDSWPLNDGDQFAFTVPAGPAYGSVPTETLYILPEPGRAVFVSAFIAPH